MKRFGALLVLLPLALSSCLVLSTWGSVRFLTRNDDEGVYLAYAVSAAREGPAAIPRLCRRYLMRPENGEFPPPTRLATIAAQAAAVRLFGESFHSLQWVSLTAFLLMLALLFFALRSLSSESTAFWTVLLLSVSPLHLGLARRALSDSLVGALCVLSLTAFILLLTARRRGGAVSHAGLALLYSAAILSREGAAILVPISLALAGVHYARRREKPDGFLLAAVSVAPLALAAFAIAAACGGAETAKQVLEANLRSVASNPYAQRYGSGPWYGYLTDFLLLSPGTTLFYLISLFFPEVRRERGDAWLLWALVPLLFLPLAAPFTKNVRYALMLETPLRLGAVGLVEAVARRRPARVGLLLMAVVMAGLILQDVVTFHHFFVESALYDPVSAHLLALRGLSP